MIGDIAWQHQIILLSILAYMCLGGWLCARGGIGYSPWYYILFSIPLNTAELGLFLWGAEGRGWSWQWAIFLCYSLYGVPAALYGLVRQKDFDIEDDLRGATFFVLFLIYISAGALLITGN